MFVYNALNFNDRKDDFGLDCGTDTITQQSFKDECDINVILKRFAVTGQLPDNVRVPQYGDFEGIFDFQSAMNVIRQSEEAFAAMSAEVRDRFSNDPARFLAFVNDGNNYDEALKLGVVNPRPKPVDRPVDLPQSTGSDAPGTSST